MKENGIKVGKIIARVVLFFALFLGILHVIQQRSFVVSNGDARRIMNSLYAEKPGTLDALYVGASNAYNYWEAPFAWQEYGIAVAQASNPNQPSSGVKYMLKEVRKTQPDALFVINLNSFKDLELDPVRMHFFTDYMHFSWNKVEAVNKLADVMGLDLLERMEYIFPIIRFHSKWSELKPDDFAPHDKQIKGAVLHQRYREVSTDLSKKYTTEDEYQELTQEQIDVFQDLLDYCKEESVPVLFVVVPQAIYPKTLSHLNQLTQIAEEQGFPTLNLLTGYEDVDLDLSTDFYNALHTNVHGALKYTHYVGAYLVEHYGFEDKRGQAEYKSWDDAAELYESLISPWCMDFERAHAPRDESLAKPANLAAAPDKEGTAVTLTWEATEGAGSYAVYRRLSDHAWEKIGETDGGTLTYTDGEVEKDSYYTYSVVPCREENGVTYYGKFEYNGVPAATGEAEAPENADEEDAAEGEDA